MYLLIFSLPLKGPNFDRFSLKVLFSRFFFQFRTQNISSAPSSLPDPPMITFPHFQTPGASIGMNCFTSPTAVSTSPIGSPSMTSSLASAACPYGTASPYAVYRSDQCPSMTSSIASLRLRAKQHTGGFGMPGMPYTPGSVSVRSPPGGNMSACQYAPTDRPL